MSFKNLFSPLKIGAVTVPNRVFMAPMTRIRSDEPGDVPTDLMGQYYRQRASSGLIITEATQISFEAKGLSGAPGVHTPEQIHAWRRINDSVHALGGHTAVQVWHTGRVSHHTLQPDGRAPMAPSALPANAAITLRDEEGNLIKAESSAPREMTVEEIKQAVADFGRAAACAKDANFDFIELHAAHGYLMHQFLSDQSNHRSDAYGGTPERRMRFVLESVDAAVSHWSADRVGIRIFPTGRFHGVEGGVEQEQEALALIRELDKRSLAYLHISEPDWTGGKPFDDAFRLAIREAFNGVIIGASGYTPDKAEALIERGLIDAVAFGRPYISNPDLVERIQEGVAFAEPRQDRFYASGPEGYVDYPDRNGVVLA